VCFTLTRRRSDVAVLAASIGVMALGEELWLAYLPAYLTALGASGVAVGVFGSARDFLDSAYQYPGGWLADRIGRRAALRLFTALAIGGYVACAVAPDWRVVFGGLLGVMAWKAGAFPATFAVIGDALPPARRATAFGVQSILVRVPRVISAPAGGILIGGMGAIAGVRAALGVSVILGLGVLLLQCVAYDTRLSAPPAGAGRQGDKTARIPAPLRRLLVADCLVRIGEGVATSFIVLFVLHVRHLSAAHYGVLYALQQLVSIASYLPGGRLGDRLQRPPVVALTFAFFALFPLAVRLAASGPALAAAFCLGGLKEIGEPSRKSLILDLAPAGERARTVGLYYAIRNLTVVPAGMLGGLLWQHAPTLPLEVAFGITALGAVVFVLTAMEL
jgi:MFS family permease